MHTLDDDWASCSTVTVERTKSSCAATTKQPGQRATADLAQRMKYTLT